MTPLEKVMLMILVVYWFLLIYMNRTLADMTLQLSMIGLQRELADTVRRLHEVAIMSRRKTEWMAALEDGYWLRISIETPKAADDDG